jgi:DNA-binding response OmpR family regulator/anti-sigma regulatory factor (Ser/Thr protein kinase)
MTRAVLVVDDSLTVRMSLVDMLEAAGFPVVACATGAEARKALAESRFALAILDILLPDTDGIELLKEIRAMPSAADTAVMLLSTETEVHDRVRGLRTGADEYVGKPYDPGYVVARARELVQPAQGDAASTGARVLLIEDSLTFREALKEVLIEAGYQVVIAGSGEEGLRLAAHVRPEGIVVDGALPGIDGATVIRRMRLDAALRRTPCLLLTASGEREAEIRALEAGADAFVRKGDDFALMLAKLQAMLRSAGVTAGDQETASLLGPKKILAVDDSETYLQSLAEMLRQDSYDVALARTGEEALELLSVQPVDCILLDLMMPGIGGIETCRRLKSAPVLRDIPVVMLTAIEDRETMIEGLGAGADDFISKSSDLSVLHARVVAQLRRKQFEDENRRFREQLLHKELEAAEARAAREVAEVRAALVEELQLKNKELDAFSYSVAHDLRAPLRAIDGFSLALLESYDDKLDEEGRQYLTYVREAAQQMAELIDNLLTLSRITRSELVRTSLDLTATARAVADRLQRQDADHRVQVSIAEGLTAEGDARLLTIVFENLLSNAWKFSRKREDATIEVAATVADGRRAFVVRDNGAGFDMAYAAKLFGVFQRLHSAREFEGTGIGLATVQRIVHRHGGRIWAEGEVGRGATFLFTLEDGRPASDEDSQHG